jgi:hypothetical protein
MHERYDSLSFRVIKKVGQTKKLIQLKKNEAAVGRFSRVVADDRFAPKHQQPFFCLLSTSISY